MRQRRLAWLLNIRGQDIPHIPIVQGFAILHDDARVDFYTHRARRDQLAEHFGDALAFDRRLHK